MSAEPDLASPYMASKVHRGRNWYSNRKALEFSYLLGSAPTLPAYPRYSWSLTYSPASRVAPWRLPLSPASTESTSRPTFWFTAPFSCEAAREPSTETAAAEPISEEPPPRLRLVRPVARRV